MRVMSEQIGEIESLKALPNWGGDFPVPHEYSTRYGLKNDLHPDQQIGGGYLDRYFRVADAIIAHWHGREFVMPYFYGPPGTGKTHGAIALGRSLAERGGSSGSTSVAYLKMPDTPNGFSFTVNNSMERENCLPSHIFGTHSQTVPDKPRARSDSPVLILDEYTPDNFDLLKIATARAEERGGLLIVTSNFVDPFGMIEERASDAPSDRDIVLADLAKKVNPEEHQRAKQLREKAAEQITAAFRSRISAAIIPVYFPGRDHRPDNSFATRYGL